MKKIININFQGRALPIEETAYDILKQYIESLRLHFSQEEGGAEILNDIESRIAELFSDRIKRGASCIVDEDVHAVIASIGRPEDLGAAEAEEDTAGAAGSGQQQYATPGTATRGRFHRNEDDKILGGVCSGIAIHLGMDPVVVRIIFVLLMGALFWVYILLWIIVPSKSVRSNITKRLYRNPDDKVIGGVCGGLAAYFHVESWVPRLVFALPFILGIVSGGLNVFMWDWDRDFHWGFGPSIFTGSLGSTLFICYIILWIAVPYATTAADKLEMKGEKVDLNSIRDTVKDGLGNLKNRAEGWSREVEESARRLSGNAAAEARSFGPQARRTGSGLGHVLGVLFKAFFLFIAGMIALGLFGALIGLLFGGLAAMPMADFILDEPWQHLLAWGGIILLLGIPLVGLITWIVRRLVGARSRNHYLGYTFSGLWVIGLISVITVAAFVVRDFRTRASVEETQSMTQPSNGKLYLSVRDDYRSRAGNYNREWFGDWDDDDAPFYGVTRDSMLMNTVRVDVARSADSLFHMYKVRLSRSETAEQAERLAGHIQFDISQADSVIHLPKGFTINTRDKFRNQQVLVVVEVPVGKKIQFDESIDDYDWFTVRTRRRNINVHWENTFNYRSNREYIMTPSGLEPTDRMSEFRDSGVADSSTIYAPSPVNTFPATSKDSMPSGNTMVL